MAENSAACLAAKRVDLTAVPMVAHWVDHWAAKLAAGRVDSTAATWVAWKAARWVAH